MLAACVHRARKRVSWYRSAARLDGAAIAIPYTVSQWPLGPINTGESPVEERSGVTNH